ncbi:MAG: hypothetical protein E7009_01440 [Alphaproteobacteria bacterium]|nr:hypothetical protein [Alphaproteobacteria bacterium]
MPSHISDTKKHFFPNLLTSIIPFRHARRSLRGILTMGIGNYLKQLRADKKTKYPHELSIAAIMKNEGPYLKEWLDFHILVGVEKFYLYDNGSTDNTGEILKPYIERGIVDYTFFPGRAQQRPAYYDVIRKHADDTRWMALIDLDEFLVPVKHKTLPEFLRTLPRFSQLIVSWVDYGSNGHMEKPDGLVIENYTKHARDNWGVKSIINPRLITYLGNPHYNYVAGPTIDENGKKIGKVNQEKNPTTINKIRCNHYITKSHAEYIARCNLGDAGSGEKVKTFGRDVETNFRRFDKSEVYDPIMKKYVTKLKKLK